MKKHIIALTSILGAFAPALAFAANQGLLDILQFNIVPILNAIIPVLITIGVIYFIFGIVQYVIADDEQAKDKGKNRMLWGLVGLFVIVTFWGLLTVIGNTFGINAEAPPTIQVDPYLYVN